MLDTRQKGTGLADPLGLGRHPLQSDLYTVMQRVQIEVGSVLDTPVVQVLTDAHQLVVALQTTTLKGLATGSVERISDGPTIVPIVMLLYSH